MTKIGGYTPRIRKVFLYWPRKTYNGRDWLWFTWAWRICTMSKYDGNIRCFYFKDVRDAEDWKNA